MAVTSPSVALLSGSPARVELMAGLLDDVEKVGDARGYLVFTGSYAGRRLTVATSGVGSPSMSIAVEELAACGTRTMIRVGSCAAISELLPVGALMVAMAAVCDEGTSRYYAPPNFPPVATRRVVDALVDAAARARHARRGRADPQHRQLLRGGAGGRRSSSSGAGSAC